MSKPYGQAMMAMMAMMVMMACSGGTPSRGARAAMATPTVPGQGGAPVAKGASATAPLDYDDKSDDPTASDRVFIENAERAIGQYSEFIARAGEREEYAAAVQRSHEQIDDLQAAIDFVRAGALGRAAH